jgi:hypothetical protein
MALTEFAKEILLSRIKKSGDAGVTMASLTAAVHASTAR